MIDSKSLFTLALFLVGQNPKKQVLRKRVFFFEDVLHFPFDIHVKISELKMLESITWE